MPEQRPTAMLTTRGSREGRRWTFVAPSWLGWIVRAAGDTVLDVNWRHICRRKVDSVCAVRCNGARCASSPMPATSCTAQRSLVHVTESASAHWRTQAFRGAILDAVWLIKFAVRHASKPPAAARPSCPWRWAPARRRGRRCCSPRCASRPSPPPPAGAPAAVRAKQMSNINMT